MTEDEVILAENIRVWRWAVSKKKRREYYEKGVISARKVERRKQEQII